MTAPRHSSGAKLSRMRSGSLGADRLDRHVVSSSSCATSVSPSAVGIRCYVLAIHARRSLASSDLTCRRRASTAARSRVGPLLAAGAISRARTAGTARAEPIGSNHRRHAAARWTGAGAGRFGGPDLAGGVPDPRSHGGTAATLPSASWQHWASSDPDDSPPHPRPHELSWTGIALARPEAVCAGDGPPCGCRRARRVTRIARTGAATLLAVWVASPTGCAGARRRVVTAPVWLLPAHDLDATPPRCTRGGRPA